MNRKSLLILIIVMALVVTSIFVMASCEKKEQADKPNETVKPAPDGGKPNPEVHEHVFGKWTLVALPTATTEGSIKRSCTKEGCAYEESFVLPKIIEGNYIFDILSEPTCQSEGKAKLTIKNEKLEYSFEITTPKTGHKYVGKVTAPTCTDKGYTTHTCLVCGDTYTDEYTEAKGHNWKVTYAWNNDFSKCTATRVCSNDDKHNMTIDAKITTDIVKPTITADGLKTITATFSENWAETQTEKFEIEKIKELSSGEIYKKIDASTVHVMVNNMYGVTTSGTGFFIDDKGTIVTTYNIIKDGVNGSIITNDNTSYDIVNVVGYDKKLDVAILSTTATSSTGVAPESLCETAVGDKVYVIGSSESNGSAYQSSLAHYMVSTIVKNGEQSYIKIDNDIVKGNSGSPLVNVYGEVVGIMTANIAVNGVQYMNLANPIRILDSVSRDVNESLLITTKRQYPVNITIKWEGQDLFKGQIKYESTITIPNSDDLLVDFVKISELYNDEGKTQKFDINTKIIENTTLYASVEKLPAYGLVIKDGVVISADKKIEKAVIPSVHKGVAVTEIDSRAFQNCDSLVEVIIPNSITTIGMDAFNSCTNMLYINIPISVTNIESSAFYKCYNLNMFYEGEITEILNVQTQTANVKKFTRNSEYRYAVFNDDTVCIVRYMGQNTDVTIPSQIEGLDVVDLFRGVFSGKHQVKSIIVPNGIRSIKDNSFAYADSLEKISLPSSVKTIGKSAFERCSSLKDIEIAEGLESISADAFLYCTALTSVDIPSTVTHMDDRIFYKCNSIVKLSIPAYPSIDRLFNSYYEPGSSDYMNINIKELTINGGEILQSSTFDNCDRLEHITVKGVKNIKLYAFFGCPLLRTVFIASDNQNISKEVFSSNSKLTIYTDAPSKPAGWQEGWNSNRPVVWNSKNNNIADDGYEYFIQDGIQYGVKAGEATVISVDTSISGAFKVPASITYNGNEYKVTKIGPEGFNRCKLLTTIILPNGIQSIGDYAFAKCTTLKKLYIPSSVTNMTEFSLATDYNPSRVIYTGAVSKLPTWNDSWNYSSRIVWNVMGIGVFGNYDYIKYNDNTAHIEKYKGKDINVIIPNQIDGASVAGVLDNAFYELSEINSITMPDSVEIIGDNAFYNCTSLKNITMPSKLTIIGASAFYNCKALQSITIPDGVTIIGDNAFYQCQSMVDVTIGEQCQLTSIGNSAFKNCSKVKYIKMPSKVTSVGDFAFYNCGELVRLYIPKSVTKMGINAVVGNKILVIYLEAVSEPTGWAKDDRSTSQIESWNYKNHTLVWNCLNNSRATDGYTHVLDNGLDYGIHNGIATVLHYTTDVPSDLVIPNTIKYNNLDYPVREIAAKALSWSNKIRKVHIPKNITSIGNDAFDYTESLVGVYIEDMAAWCNISFGNVLSNPLNYAHKLYLNNNLVTNPEIPSTITSIKSYVFVACPDITEIIIPRNITNIEACAFYNCGSINNLTILGDSITLGDAAFSSCSIANKITIPMITQGLNSAMPDSYYKTREIVITNGTSLANKYFYNAAKLKKVTLPSTLTSIGDWAFSGCQSITSITIPDGVTSIGEYAFNRCGALTNINIPSGVTSIGYRAFIECNSLSSITIPGGVKNMGDEVLYNCNGLASVTILDGVTTISKSMFSNCSNLRSVTIPDSITSIGDYAFKYCSNLTTINIPRNVTSIGQEAFANCDFLEVIRIPIKVQTLGAKVFNNCPVLKIYVEASRKVSGWSFDWNYSNRPVVWYGCDGLEHTYTFNTNGGSAIEPIIDTGIIDINSVPRPTKEGMHFDGWYNNPECTGNAVVEMYYNRRGATLYAKWLTNEEYISSCDGSSLYRAKTIEEGKTQTIDITRSYQTVYYKFVASETRLYNFIRENIVDNGSTMVYCIYDANKKPICNLTNYISCKYTFTAGETYYIDIRLYPLGTSSAFDLTIS